MSHHFKARCVIYMQSESKWIHGPELVINMNNVFSFSEYDTGKFPKEESIGKVFMVEAGNGYSGNNIKVTSEHLEAMMRNAQ